MPGPQPQQLFSMSVTLTDTDIKALPTTPYVVIPATEILNYSGTPNQLFVPLLGMVYPVVHDADYTNINAGCVFGIDFGSDDSSTFSTRRVGAGLLNLPDITYFIVTSQVPSGVTLAWSNTLEDGLQDNAVVFFAANQGSGNFTGVGTEANTLKVTVLYTVFNL